MRERRRANITDAVLYFFLEEILIGLRTHRKFAFEHKFVWKLFNKHLAPESNRRL